MKSLSSGESGSQFAALKKDLLFHEKRIQLLLSSSIVEGFAAAIQEKLTTRDECADDCKKTLEKLSHASQMPTLSGRWNESVVASVLQLSIPLRDVVGSQLFEQTPTAECEDLKDLVRQLSEQSQDHAEFKGQQQQQQNDKQAALIADAVDNSKNNDGSGIGPDSQLVKQLVKAVNPNALSLRDVKRMKEAVASKLRVISELSHLSEALQKSGFQLAQVRANVCRLQDEEAAANEDGEVAVSEVLIEQRIAALEKIIDIVFFRLHTVDATVDTNVTKRHSNLQALQHSAVALEGVKREKQDSISNCGDDMRRIDRSLQLQQVKERNDSRGAELLAESEKKLKDIEGKRRQLQGRLQELGDEFVETERALSKLGVERAVAIDRHLDLVEQSRHLQADFAEMARFATAHRKNLETTKDRNSEGLGAVELLERLLLQETDFMQYNFRASAQRLQQVRENVANELRGSLREYEISIGEMLRRKQEMVLQLDDQIHVAQCEAELRKDVLDPTAKKYVDKQRALEGRRQVLIDEMCALSEKLGQQISTIKSRLGEEFVTSVGGVGSGGGSGPDVGNTNVSTRSLGARSGGGGGGGQQNDAKKLITQLRGKLLQEMSALEAAAPTGASPGQQESLWNSTVATSSQQHHHSPTGGIDASTSSHIRDVVDGVSRLTEDEELYRRNLRKHERLLDNRQTLLESRNQQLEAVEEKKEIAALAQNFASSTYSALNSHKNNNSGPSSARHRDALASPTGLPQQQMPYSYSRAATVREEIRRAKSRASALFSSGADEDNGPAQNMLPNYSTVSSSGGAAGSGSGSGSGLAQVLVPASSRLNLDDDDDDDKHNVSSFAAGSAAMGMRKRDRPRVIGRSEQ